jgi:hypothetical protein
MKRVTVLLLFVLGLLQCAGADSIDNPFDRAGPQEFLTAIELNKDVKKVTDSSENSILQSMYQRVLSLWNGMRDETHPTAVVVTRLSKDISTYNQDNNDYKADKAKYEADLDAYKAAGGGGTYRTDDPKYAQLVAWFNRLNDWKARLDSWNDRLNAKYKDLNDMIRSTNSDLAKLYSDFKSDCTLYANTFEVYLKRQELRDKYAAMKKQCDQDKRALEYYKDKLPGLYADVEKMALDADQAREDGQMLAIDKLTGMALDGLISKVSAREVVEKADLAKIKSILAKHGVVPADVGIVLGNHRANATMKLKTMLEQFSQFRDVAAAYDNTTKQQYMEALAGCLGIFVQDPMLKLVQVNFEVYSSLMYTGLSAALAKARVRQYNTLSESQLRAVAKVSDVYKKHVRELSDLKKQLEAVGVVVG